MEARLIGQLDTVLSKCGRPISPSGASVVDLGRRIPVQQYFPIAPPTAFATLTREVPGETTFVLKAISVAPISVTAISLQIMLSDGRFLINNLQDVLQIAGYGHCRYLFKEVWECPPGSKIQVTLADTNTAVAQPISILFEGADRYFRKGGAPRACSAQNTAMPRYLRNFAENIMAPCWMQGIGPATPPGLRDDEYTYASSGQVTTTAGVVLPGGAAIDVANGPFQGTQEIPIDAGSDFRCRRLLFQLSADDTVTAGTILCKIRTGNGYALCDDYFDVATYIGSSPMAIDWEIRASDTVYVDMQLVDQAGTGNIYLQSYLEGVKRSVR